MSAEKASLSDIALRAVVTLISLRRRLVPASFAILLMMAMVSTTSAEAPETIRQRFEFHDVYVPKLGTKQLPGGSKPWTKAERTAFLRQVDRAYDAAPNIVKQVVLYRKVRSYRAKNPKFGAIVSLPKTNGMIVPDWFLHRPSGVSKDEFDRKTLFTVVHELTHLYEPFGSLSYDPRWQALAAPRIQKIRDHFKAEDKSVTEAYERSKPRTQYDSLAQAQGLPSLYAAISLREALAEVTATMVTMEDVEIPPDMRAFVQANILEKNVTKEPAKELAHQAMTALEEGDIERAKQLFGDAEKAGANWVGINCNRGDMWQSIMMRGGKGALSYGFKALAYYMRATKVAGSDGIDVLLDRGRIQSAFRDYRGAATAFSAYLAIDLHNTKALLWRATAYQKGKEWRKALADFDTLISRKLDTLAIRQGRAEVRLALGDAAGAIDDVNAAIHIAGGSHADLFECRGRANQERGDSNHAIADFTKAIELDKDYYIAYMERAGAFFLSGRFEEARTDFTNALRLHPDDPSLYHLRGLASNAKADYDAAIADFTEAIQRSPKNHVAYYHRGGAWQSKGHFAEAIADYNEAIKLYPKYAPAFNSLAWIYSNCPDKKFRDGKKAIEMGTKACELTEWKSGEALAILASAYAHTGDFKSAIEWQTKAIHAPKKPDDTKAAQERLKLYSTSKPIQDNK